MGFCLMYMNRDTMISVRINSVISTFFRRFTPNEFVAWTSCFFRSSFESSSRSERVLAWAPMAELRLIMTKDRIMRTARSPMLVEGVAPQASPIMSDPRFGSRNSARETVANDFMVSSILTGQEGPGNKNSVF